MEKDHRKNLLDFGNQAVSAVKHLVEAIDFIRFNKLWKGFLQCNWMATTTMIVAAIFSIRLFRQMSKMIQQTAESEGLVTKMSALSTGINDLSHTFILSGGLKYLVLIFIEMMIYYFTVRTHEILSGEQRRKLLFNDFKQAQIRMIKVALRSWIYELIFTILISIALGALGFNFLKDGMIWFVQCFFLGFAFLDNYNEQFHIPIKQSFKIGLTEVGASLAVGLVAYVLILIPLIGPLLASFICAVGMTLYMHDKYKADQLVLIGLEVKK